MTGGKLFERFPKPEVILGQHVLPPPAGEITYRPGITQSEEDNIEVRLIGRGGHGAWPEATVDPVVMAAATVLRLQTVVSRETAADEPVVVTVGALQAGNKGNVIPDPDLYRRAEEAGRVAEDVPTNHSSKFAPVMHPTLEVGIQTLVTATLSYLGA